MNFSSRKITLFRHFSETYFSVVFEKKIFGFSRWIFDSFCWSLLPGGGACGLIALSLSARPLHFFFFLFTCYPPPSLTLNTKIELEIHFIEIYEDFVRSHDQKVKSEEEERSKWVTGTDSANDLNSHVPSSSPFTKSNFKFWSI